MAGQGNIEAFLNQAGLTPSPENALKLAQAAGEAEAKEKGRQKADAAKQRQSDALQRQAQRQAGAQQLQAQRFAQQQAEAQQEKEQATTRQALGAGIQTTKDRLGALGNSVETWAENVPTPGGIGLILLAIIFLLWVVVPVNGNKTRLQLLWLTLTGRTRLASTPDGGGTYDPRGAGGTFGGQAQTGTGSGGFTSNGHSTTSTADLLAQLNIRDWGGAV